jgi:hypothetical protein
MDVTIAGAKGLPDKAFLSLRVSEQRKQSQFKAGECYHFDLQQPSRHIVVDVFEKVGSTKVSLSELSQAANGPGLADRVQVPRSDGSAPMELDLEVVVRDAAMAATKAPRKPVRQEEAVKAKSYLDGHGVGSILHEMVHEMLRDMPDEPLAFMRLYLQDRKSSVPAAQPSSGHSRAQLEQQVDQLKRELQEQTVKLRAATAASGATPAVASSDAGVDAAKARKDELRRLTGHNLFAGRGDGRLEAALSAKSPGLSARGELRK